MEDLVESGAGEVLLGLCIGALALAFPFRRATSRSRPLWDIAAAAVSVAFGFVGDSLLGMPGDAVMARLDGWFAGLHDAPLWIVVPAYVVVADFGAYWAHRLLHSRWLWPTHAWHHSPKHMNWIAGLRGSPLHMIVMSVPYYFAFALFPVPEAGVASIALFVIDTSNQHYIHSNLKVPFAERLERVLVTPRCHFVHHSATEHVANCNYGFVFSVWDRIFGTYTDPASVPSDDPLGLGYEISGWRLVLGLPVHRLAGPRVELEAAEAGATHGAVQASGGRCRD
jgi:sterol desaturase/sphingolipid hydroxylase (fatty acid hydroxylase superfamily)